MNWILDRFCWGENMGTNPASVDTKTGMLILNPRVWEKYTTFEKNFIIAHEEGHFVNPNGSEEDADLYAIKKLAGTEPKSLAKSIATLDKIPNITEERLDMLYYEALKIDAQMGNNEAKEKIEKFETMYNKRTTFPKKVRRADGDNENDIIVSDPKSKVEPGRSHKTNGIVLGGFYFSFTNIILLCTLIFMIRSKK